MPSTPTLCYARSYEFPLPLTAFGTGVLLGSAQAEVGTRCWTPRFRRVRLGSRLDDWRGRCVVTPHWGGDSLAVYFLQSETSAHSQKVLFAHSLDSYRAQ